jgi:hypothetical protein
VDNNAFVFGDDIYVDDPSECSCCARFACCCACWTTQLRAVGMLLCSLCMVLLGLPLLIAAAATASTCTLPDTCPPSPPLTPASAGSSRAFFVPFPTVATVYPSKAGKRWVVGAGLWVLGGLHVRLHALRGCVHVWRTLRTLLHC